MTTATDQFFTSLAERGQEPLLSRANGSVRMDLDGQHWYLELAKGNVTVSHRDDPADCVIRSDRETFDRVARGESNAMAALLRNEIMFDGDPGLVVMLQRVFPWPSEGPNR